MLKISRGRRDENGRKIEPNPAWLARAEAATRQALQDGRRHNPDDGVYAAAEVRRALEKLFHGKCAYCECRLSRWDWKVEHFRPKKRVFERRDHPGYYWLCYDWQNLFPACTFCNEYRRARPTWSGRPGTAGGKADKFPLSDESSRVMSGPSTIRRLRKGLRGEKRLLLNPCEDRPSDHLVFDRLGNVAAVSRSELGARSIEVFNLTEPRLVENRRVRIEETVTLIRLLAARDRRTQVLTIIKRAVRVLGKDSGEHAAAVRAISLDPSAFGFNV